LKRNSGALLVAVGLAHRTVHVQDELGELAVAVGLVDPLPGEIHQMLEVLCAGECIRLEACHLTGGGCRLILGPTPDHDPHRGIEAKTLGIIDIFIAGQTAVDRLAKESQQAVLGVLPRAGVNQAARGRASQSESVVEFTIGKESGITGNGRAVELQLDLTVEIDTQGVILAVTHWVPLSFRQEVVGNAGFSREKAQTPCRNNRAIWEIRGHGRASVEGRATIPS
jgi:hypothetical protein